MTGDTKVCLDLFAGLGGFSHAFEWAEGWSVVTVDLEAEFQPDLCADVLDLRPEDLLEAIGLERAAIDVLVVLASPPCTEFSPAGNHDHWDFDAKEPAHPDAREAIALVHHAVGLVESLAPDYWFVENPRGRMRWVLGPPTGTVTYCQYGTSYQKPTDLWGRHPPMTYRRCPRGGSCHESNTEDDGRCAVASMDRSSHAERSKVPEQLSEAILESVESALAHPQPEQATLMEATHE